MLIYHFGTRDALLRAVLGRARQRQLDAFGDLLRARPGEPYATTLGRAWTSITGAAGRPYLRMFSALRESAEQQLWPGFRRSATTDWLGPLEDGLRSTGRPELATLVQERCFYHLEAPIERVAGWDTPYPHAYEWAYFPGPKRLKFALEKVMAD